ncbi:hypothetical protein PYK79_57250 [Streptomyces sp. ID05-04B]|nr:hypothetical protein [Streptomyces sp. ID05-04B]
MKYRHHADGEGDGAGAHGTSRRVGHHVHVDSGPSERAHGTRRAVVKGIPVDPQENGGDAGAEQRLRHFSVDPAAAFTDMGDQGTRKPYRRWRGSFSCDFHMTECQ